MATKRATQSDTTATPTSAKPNGPLDNERPGQSGMWTAVQAQADFAKLNGNPKAIVSAVQKHQSSPDYIGELAVLVGKNDSKWPDAQKKAPAWQLAQAAGSARSDFSSDAGGDRMHVESNNRGDPNTVKYQEEMISLLMHSKSGANLGSVIKNDQGTIDGDVTTHALALGLVQAERDGVVDASRIASDKRQGFQAMNLGSGPVAGLAGENEALLANGVDDSQSKLSSANNAIASLNNRLAVELAQVGPTLSVQQQQAYVQKFFAMGEYKAAVAQRAQAATALDHTASTEGKSLTAFADHAVDPTLKTNATNELIKANQTLAASSPAGAASAIQWADKAIVDPAFKSSVPTIRTIVTTAQQTMMAALGSEVRTLLAKGKGDFGSQVEAAVQRIDAEYLQPFESCKNVVALKDVPAMIQKFQIKRLIAGGKAGDARVVAYLHDLTAEAAKLDSWSKRVVSILIDGIGASAAAFDPQMTKNAAKILGDSQQFIENTRDLLGRLQHLKSGESLAADELAALKLVGQRGSLLSRLLPGVGLTASIAATAADWQTLQKGGSPAAVVAVAGDAISTLGASIELIPIPGAAEIGGAIGLVGAAISAISGLFSSGKTPEQVDAQKLLGKGSEGDQGINAYGPGLISTFTSGSSAANIQYAAKAGIGHTELQTLGQKLPGLFKGDNAMFIADSVRKWLQQPAQGGLKGNAGGSLSAFLTALSKNPSASQNAMQVAARLGFLGGHGPTDPAERSGVLAQFVGGFAVGGSPVFPASDFSSKPTQSLQSSI